MILTATTRRRFGSVALYTADIPPCPKSSSILYLPPRVLPIQLDFAIGLLQEKIQSVRFNSYSLINHSQALSNWQNVRPDSLNATIAINPRSYSVFAFL